jgi:Ca2+-binding RTX toxin-like protein
MELGTRISRTSLVPVVLAFVIVASLALWSGARTSRAADCDANRGHNGTTTVEGTSGDDRCVAGGNGPDLLMGKGGDDFMVAGRGPDRLRGGPGDDVLRGGQGPDRFVCGPGDDVVMNSRSTGTDSIDDSCETVL